MTEFIPPSGYDADDDDDETPVERPVMPGSIKAASIIVIALGVLYVAGSYRSFQIAGDEEWLADNDASATAVRVLGGVSIVVGLAYVATGVLLRRASRPARIAAMVLCGLGVLIGILSLPSGLLVTVLNGIVLYLVVRRPESKAFFARPATATPERDRRTLG